MSAEQSTVDLRRERLMMRAFQNPLVGPLLRRVASPQDIITDGMAFWVIPPHPDRCRTRHLHDAGAGTSVGT